MMRLLPARPTEETSLGDEPAEQALSNDASPVRWMRPNVATVREIGLWGLRRMWKDFADGKGPDFFDMVGVVTFVGRVERQRAGTLSAFRWIMLIDRSTRDEAVIQLEMLSQPSAFRSIKAGDVVMLTKLRWSSGYAGAVACTSAFSRIVLNDDLEPFMSIEHCSLARSFAETLSIQHLVVEGQENGSELEGPVVSAYDHWLPLHERPAQKIISTLASERVSLHELPHVTESLAALESKWVLVCGDLNGLHVRHAGSKSEAVVVMKDHGTSRTQSFRARPHHLFGTSMQSHLIEAATEDGLLFLELLDVSTIDAFEAQHKARGHPQLSVETITELLNDMSDRHHLGVAVCASRAANGAVAIVAHAIVSLTS
ncbi:hypothetical protein PINS_up010000 [Pythium insidiosum]|nr:hypothetical protein PINS_up010000 [Pythium insidiosum]